MLNPVSFRGDVEGLRAVAVASVIGFHFFPEIVLGGFLGVDVFFVISGFVVSRLIIAQLEAGQFSFVAFFERRAQRLLPALGLVLAVVATVGAFVLFVDELLNLGRYLLAGLIFGVNWLAWLDTGYFDTSASAKPLLHLWSLGVEGQFYLLLPAVLVLLAARFRSLVVIGLCAGSLGLSLWFADAWSELDFYSLISRVWEFGAGVLLALLERSGFWRQGEAARWSVGWVSLYLVLTAVFGLYGFREGVEARLLVVLGTSGLLWSGSINRGASRLLALAPFRFGGRLSYALYLWHWPVWVYFGLLAARRPGGWECLGLLIAVWLLSWLTLGFERWLRSLAWRGDARRFAGQAAWGLLALAGSAWVLGGGWPDRGPAYAVSKQFEWLPKSNAKCVERLGLDRAYCAWSGEGAGIAVFGDSHANALYPGLVEWFGKAGASVVNLGLPGCMVLDGVRRTDIGNTASCDQITRKSLAWVVGEPSLSVVILAGRYAEYLTPHSSYGDGADSGGRAIEAGLRSTISRLEASGKRVVLSLPVPEPERDLAKPCIVRRPFGFSDNSRRCGVPRFEVEARQAEFRRIVADVQVSFPNLLVVDPLSILCDSDFCYSAISGRSIYRDRDHLSVFGSLVVASLFVGLW